MIPVFITGTGTGIGKTIVSVIVCNALQAGYWKPVQAGDDGVTDKELVNQFMFTGNQSFPEVYMLSKPASPHIAARIDDVRIDLDHICEDYTAIKNNQPGNYLVIEGAGGLLVPLNDQEFMLDLILKLKARVILVSRNYLGSINHSLLTAEVCRHRGVDVLGWIFNDEFMQYEDEIVRWSGYPLIGCIPKLETINREVLHHHSMLLSRNLFRILEMGSHE